MARYDLTDEEWAVLGPLLPRERSGRAGNPYRPHREVVNGIFWVLRSGAPWRDLPERYGPWTTVYDRFRRWRRDGLFQKMLNALEAQARRAERIDFEFSAVDGSTVRAHKSAAGARKKGRRPRRATSAKPSAGVEADSQPSCT
jgi:transposase